MIQMMKWSYDRIARIDRWITRIECVTTKASPIWIVALYECKLLLNTTEALHQNFYVRYFAVMCRLLTNRINAILFHSYNLFARTNVVIGTEDTLSHQKSQSRTKHTSAPWHYSPVQGIKIQVIKLLDLKSPSLPESDMGLFPKWESTLNRLLVLASCNIP